MNNSFNNKRRLIIPSSRKSIHSHFNCPFADCENMGRYCLDDGSSDQGTSRPRKLPSHTEHHPFNDSTDEVDNVMSKMLQRTSPSPIQHINKLNKRNSLTPQESQTYSSDSESCDDTSSRNHETSYKDVSRSFDRSSNYSHQYNRSQNNVNTVNRSTNRSKKNIQLTFLLTLVSTVVAIWYMDYLNNVQGILSNSYNEEMFYKDLLDLGQKYNIDDDVILRLQSGVVSIFRKRDTGSFIFIHNNEHLNQFNDFVNEVANVAAKYLRNESSHVSHIVVENEKLDMGTHIELINKYKDTLSNNGVILIEELENIPSKLAMAFHYYCDEYNPLVKRSAIFFTLDISKCSFVKGHSVDHGVIEKCLSEKWQSLPKDNMGPLLTRIVNVVIDLSNSFYQTMHN